MNIPPSTMHNSSKCSKNPGYLCTVMILSGCCFWVLSSRRGWAGLLGVLGGDLIVPATTPVPHLTSLGDLYRSCRSNQSSPDCSHLTVVIRPTPNDFCEFFSSQRPPYQSLFLTASTNLVYPPYQAAFICFTLHHRISCQSQLTSLLALLTAPSQLHSQDPLPAWISPGLKVRTNVSFFAISLEQTPNLSPLSAVSQHTGIQIPHCLSTGCKKIFFLQILGLLLSPCAFSGG